MAQSNTQSSTPHSLSLKVLRLSRPSLATQTPLPATTFGPPSLNISPEATLAHPSTDPASRSSPLTPLLTLPASFGAAYVGETFSCTLCVNNDLEKGPDGETGNNNNNNPTITAVRVTADLQTPSNTTGFPLELTESSNPNPKPENPNPSTNNSPSPFPPTTTTQTLLSHSLKEPGPHVLAVTVHYTETSLDASGVAVASRARTFRKLYQFVAQPVLAVRSKIGVVVERGGCGRGSISAANAAYLVAAGKQKKKKWVLEAQLENVGGEGIVVERCLLKAGAGVTWRGGIGGLEDGEEDVHGGEEGGGGEVRGGGKGKSVVLRPRDVQQVMFVVEDREEIPDGTTSASASAGPKALAQVDIDWRSAMGEKGRLTTGWLAARA